MNEQRLPSEKELLRTIAESTGYHLVFQAFPWIKKSAKGKAERDALAKHEEEIINYTQEELYLDKSL
jgi:hypothetical protein